MAEDWYRNDKRHREILRSFVQISSVLFGVQKDLVQISRVLVGVQKVLMMLLGVVIVLAILMIGILVFRPASPNRATHSPPLMVDSAGHIQSSSGFLKAVSERLLKTAIHVGSKADLYREVEKQVVAVAAATGKTMSTEATKQVTDALMCSVFGIGCSPPTTVVINYSPRSERLGVSRIDGSEKSAWMSIFFGKEGSIDDGGATKREIVPRLQRIISTASGCGIFVDGNADAKGSDRDNLRLSMERAKVVRDELKHAFPHQRFGNVLPHGERDLLEWTPDGEADINNRRVDIYVTCPWSSEAAGNSAKTSGSSSVGK